MSETTVAPAAPGSETTEATQRDLEYHGKAHGATGRDKVLHPLLGGLHTGSGSGSGGASDLPVLGDLIVAQGSPAAWQRYGIVIPAGAALRNALVTDLGDTVPTHKPTLDATNPTTIAEAAAAAPGTSLIYSHRDHSHGAPATWTPSAHPVLDSTYHSDVLTGTITRGDVLYGNSTPKIARLAKPSTPALLYNNATDVSWNTLAWQAVSFNAADYAAVTAGTWTVASGDVLSFKYLLVGKTMWINFIVQTSTVARSGGSPVYLSITIPAGKTVNGNHVNGTAYLLDNGVYADGLIQATGTLLFISRTDFAQWATATDTTAVWGSVCLETT